MLTQLALEYHEASGEQKRLLLDGFTQVTGYHRTYACWFLNQHKPRQPLQVRPRPHHRH